MEFSECWTGSKGEGGGILYIVRMVMLVIEMTSSGMGGMIVKVCVLAAKCELGINPSKMELLLFTTKR